MALPGVRGRVGGLASLLHACMLLASGRRDGLLGYVYRRVGPFFAIYSVQVWATDALTGSRFFWSTRNVDCSS